MITVFAAVIALIIGVVIGKTTKGTLLSKREHERIITAKDREYALLLDKFNTLRTRHNKLTDLISGALEEKKKKAKPVA